MTHSVAIIDACKPWHWRDKFPPTNTPSPEVARKAREKFGWLLNSRRHSGARHKRVYARLRRAMGVVGNPAANSDLLLNSGFAPSARPE